MAPRSLLLALVFVLAACGGGGGGLASDGGVSGTGISAVTGNVAEIAGGNGDLAGISVTVAGTDLRAETDADGFFSVSGELDGAVTLVFERPADGLAVQVGLQVPAGGTVDLVDVVLDGPSGAARPARRAVSFRGRIDSVDCDGARLFVVSRFESARLVFTVRLDRTVVRGPGDRPLSCDELRAGLDVGVSGLVQDDESIADGEVVVTPQATPTPTRTRAPATPTPVRSPLPRPSATDGDGVPVPPTPTVLPTDAPAPPTARPTEPPARPTATATATRRPPSPTPTRVRPSPTPTRRR